LKECEGNVLTDDLNAFLSNALFKTKKKGMGNLLIVFYGRFLRAMMMTAPTTMIATIMPMIPGSKYWSAIDGG